MGFLQKIEMTNFMCFREKTTVELSQGTYLIGSNNSGKTVTLLAVRCFFDHKLFSNETFLNKTEFLGKGAGYNKAIISIYFNLEEVNAKGRKQRLMKKYGKTLMISKSFTFRPVTKTIIIEYEINRVKSVWENLDDDIKKILEGVHITYLHPQEGTDLLMRAENKLKDRLLLNWGRRGGVTDSLQTLKDSWDDLRKQANKYLSKSLTNSLQDVWPGSIAKINLPKSVEDIIAIADIGFQGNKNLPEIQLTSQGTGAQSIILYLTHFLLDSDRSLHTGEYHPLWLLEEPESFLHADLIFKLSKQLNAKNWINNIQMVFSTHSPIILANSRINKEKIQWVLLNKHTIDKNKLLVEWDEKEVKEIGRYMGDSNFYIYFSAASTKDLIFIEDKRPETTECFVNSGIDVSKALNGSGEIKRYIDALLGVESLLVNNVYFIIDRDRGCSSFSRYMKKEVGNKSYISKYQISKKMFLIVLPNESAVEDLFDEFDNHLEECIDKLFKKIQNRYKLADNVDRFLSRTYVELRGKDIPNEKSELKKLIKNTQDVKDAFWKIIKKDNLKIADIYVEGIKNNLGITN